MNEAVHEVPASADAAASPQRAPGAGEKPGGESASRPLPDDALIILPARNMVMFPGVVMPITIGRARSQAAAQEAVRLSKPIGVLLQTSPETEEPGPTDLHWVGTSARLSKDGSTSIEKPGDGLQPDVRVRRHIHRFTIGKGQRPEPVKKTPWSHQPPVSHRQRSHHHEVPKLDFVVREGLDCLPRQTQCTALFPCDGGFFSHG